MKNMLKLALICFILVGCKEKKAEDLTVVLNNGEKVVYSIKSAETPEDLMKGLMFVENMPENEGMIFDLRHVDGASMWMKNTKIPLDMLFIDNDGKVVWIHENAEPMSEDLITSPNKFGFVLELNAGQVKKSGIEIDNTVKHKFFNK